MSEELQLDIIPPESGGDSCHDAEAQIIDEELETLAQQMLSKFTGLKGLSTREKVRILMIQHGWSQSDVARGLGVSRQAVSQHWAVIIDGMELNPQPERTRAMIRNRLEGSFTKACRITDPERSVIVQLKVLELMAKLDGLNSEADNSKGQDVNYATPAHIQDSVRAKLLELHNRQVPAEKSAE